MFDPVISEVLDLIQGQVDRNGTKGVDALLLVGGFSGSEYRESVFDPSSSFFIEVRN